MTARYGRAPSDALLALLADGAFLAPLRARWTVAGVPLDLQLREDDVVHLYCGLTRLVGARHDAGEIQLFAASTYTSQACASELFRTWSVGEGGFGEALRGYLSAVAVEARWLRKEGLVQAEWMAVREPWVTLDREAVLGRSSSAARALALDLPAVHAAHDAVHALAVAGRWGRLAPLKGANELDQLAVDPQGRLVLVELKAARASDVGTAPLQALRYAWEWHDALPTVLPALGALLAARRRLALIPVDTPELTGELRVVVAWGDGSPSAEVHGRMLAVKEIADAHMPPGRGRVEIWGLPGGTAARLA